MKGGGGGFWESFMRGEGRGWRVLGELRGGRSGGFWDS